MDDDEKSETSKTSSYEEPSERALITVPIPISRQVAPGQDAMSLAISVSNLGGSSPSPNLVSFSLPSLVASSSSSWTGHFSGAVIASGSLRPLPIEEYLIMSWQTRCSICFDRHCEFSLPKCQDQFCRECMRHFISEVVRHGAWGLAKVEVKCPVCHDPLSREVWSRYADHQTLEFYERHVKLAKIVSRFCGKCGDELRVFDGIVTSLDARRNLVEDILNQLGCLLNHDVSFDVDSFQMKLYEVIALNTCYSIEDAYATYLDYAIRLKETWLGILQRQPQKKNHHPTPISLLETQLRTINLISSKLLQLWPSEEETLPWQFQHISHFPNTVCSTCETKFCFQCGESDWHLLQTCESHLEEHVNQLKQHDPMNPSIENLSWKLQHSKRCPNCMVFIFREEGCNQVNCLYCGFKFCWICRSKWSKNCAFFKCGSLRDQDTFQLTLHHEDSTGDDESTNRSSSHQATYETELGVPDILRIRERLPIE